jgi:hypothetical protein
MFERLARSGVMGALLVVGLGAPGCGLGWTAEPPWQGSGGYGGAPSVLQVGFTSGSGPVGDGASSSSSGVAIDPGSGGGPGGTSAPPGLAAEVLADCDSGSQILETLTGPGCHDLVGSTLQAGASWLTLAPKTLAVLYGGAGCSGASVAVTTETNFCNTDFDIGGGGTNDAVWSIALTAAP